MKITVTRKEEVEVCYLLADVEPRYFEDAEIDGVSDENGTLTPCVTGKMWQPLIDLIGY